MHSHLIRDCVTQRRTSVQIYLISLFVLSMFCRSSAGELSLSCVRLV